MILDSTRMADNKHWTLQLTEQKRMKINNMEMLSAKNGKKNPVLFTFRKYLYNDSHLWLVHFRFATVSHQPV